MESLDTGYALLSDVNARNRELQARLRSSLPLLWTTNALVMTSAAGPRRRRAVAEQSAVGEADQMLLAVEGQSSLQVSRQYKRRVEWEVARRIARVDRELQQYPPAQRSWNQRREVTPPQSSSCGQRANAARRTEVRGTARFGQAVRTGVNDKATVNRQEKKGWAKPKIATEADGEVRRVLKHVATSPLRGVLIDIEDKENAKPNAVTRAQFEAEFDVNGTREPPVLTATNKEASESLDERPMSEETMEDIKTKDLADIFETASNAPSTKLVDAKPDSPRQVSSFQADGILANENYTIASHPQDSEDGNMFAIEENRLRRRKTPQQEERPSSSIGRQVLSDFRTMPSVASFGAQPILSGGMGSAGDMRLNSDVLRRLFSDLDTDKDGHVNRIETCMALHRLQISVPTPKIISFFRHIHSFDTNGARSRHTSHLPMKEVINYKEFVAFVTAAYDRQQQRKAQRRRVPTRKEKVLTLSAPSTSLPIYAQPTNSPRANRPVRAPPPSSREEDIRIYEVSDADSEPREAAIEDRVIKEIPDFLVSRILADATSAVSADAKENAASIVRKSLELVVGKEAVDDKIVNEITQELIRERLRNIAANLDATEDITGLKRAEAYYNELMMPGDAESDSIVEDSSSEDLVNWVDVLTEEQVCGLVQQIWKDRQAGLRHVPLAPEEDVHIENLTDMPEVPTARWIDEATDTNELSAPVILSEKAVQAFDEDNQEGTLSSAEEMVITVPEENQESMQVSNSAVPDFSSCHPQTHFGRAILNSLSNSGHDSSSHEWLRPVTSIGILQQLRQQRRLHQSILNRQPSCTDEAITNAGPSVSTRGQTIGVQFNPLDTESVFASEEDSESVSNSSVEHVQLNSKAEMQGLVSSPKTELAPLTQKMLDQDNSVSNGSSLELAKSASVSSSGFSFSSDYQTYGIYREIDHQLHAKTRRRRPYRRQCRLSVSGSSVPDSICSAELSDGELSREEALDLSDGEIFGASKRDYCKRKNAISNVMESKEDDSLHDSIEPGELPALMKTHANFRRQLVAQSTSSSIESGELEDGAVSDK
ncbi:hypothetical protein JG688_00000546 [Phytophthora aleatoria]|uniref:EF-hand domain-containing protein n=1 Tax=Phytophthora aleatoria TaxID=2496075 RepID=A0A8J5IYU4_9STRA|nr:hypothetical protein JG688_00000546 [Phytophthora aleatoria]